MAKKSSSNQSIKLKLTALFFVHQTSKNIVRNSAGEVVSKGTPPPGAVWAEANGPHYSIENIGDDTIHLYRIEVK